MFIAMVLNPGYVLGLVGELLKQPVMPNLRSINSESLVGRLKLHRF